MEPISEYDIAELWINLTQAFGQRFTSSYGEQDNGVWLEMLRDFTRIELGQGFKIMLSHFKQQERERKEVWPPNVKEFYLYCCDIFKYHGLASPRAAYDEAQYNISGGWHWSHPTIFYATVCMNDPFIKNDDFHTKLKFYKKYYLMTLQLHLTGRLPMLPASEKCDEILSGLKLN